MTLDLQQLQNAELVDQNGEKVGDVGQIYVDDKTNQPSFATVKTGLFGNNDTFVPLAGAQSVDGKLQVPYDKDFIKDSPNVDAGGHISEQEQAEIYRYYGMTDPSTAGVAGTAGNTGDSQYADQSRADYSTTDSTADGQPSRGETYAAGTAGAAGVAGVAGAGYAAEEHHRHQHEHHQHEHHQHEHNLHDGQEPGTFTEGNRGGDYNDGVGTGTYAPDGQYAGDRTPSEYDSTHDRSGQVYDETDNPGRHGGQVYDEPRTTDPRVGHGDGQAAATYAADRPTAGTSNYGESNYGESNYGEARPQSTEPPADTQRVGGSYDQPLDGGAPPAAGAGAGATVGAGAGAGSGYEQPQSYNDGVGTGIGTGAGTDAGTGAGWDDTANVGRDSATDTTYADQRPADQQFGENVRDDNLNTGGVRKESFIDKIKDRLTGDDHK